MVSGFLALLLLGIADFGNGFWTQMQVGAAARAGAEEAARNGYNSATIQTAETNATSLRGMTAGTPSEFCGCANGTSGIAVAACSTTCTSGETAGTYVTVTAQASYTTIFHWPGLNDPLTLASSVTVRLN